MTAAIVADGLGKRYGQRDVLQDVGFTVQHGEIAALLGNNGAGKSTAIGLMTGLTRGAGECRFDGQRFAELASPATVVGVLSDGTPLLPGWSAVQHLRTFATLVGTSRRRADEVAELVGLAHVGGKPAKAFSLGMRQRLGLGLALLGEPTILVLDEPAVGLDPGGVQWLHVYLRRFADAGGAVLLSTHHLAEVQSLADTVLVLRDGRLAERDAVASFVARHEPEVIVVRALDPDALLARLVAVGAVLRERRGDTLRVTGVTSEQVADVAWDGAIRLRELTVERGSLVRAFDAASREPAAEFAPAADLEPAAELGPAPGHGPAAARRAR